MHPCVLISRSVTDAVPAFVGEDGLKSQRSLDRTVCLNSILLSPDGSLVTLKAVHPYHTLTKSFLSDFDAVLLVRRRSAAWMSHRAIEFDSNASEHRCGLV